MKTRCNNFIQNLLKIEIKNTNLVEEKLYTIPNHEKSFDQVYCSDDVWKSDQ